MKNYTQINLVLVINHDQFGYTPPARFSELFKQQFFHSSPSTRIKYRSFMRYRPVSIM